MAKNPAAAASSRRTPYAGGGKERMGASVRGREAAKRAGGKSAAHAAAAKTFTAVLQPLGGRLRWTGVRIPFDAARLWGRRGNIRVRGEINGFGFRANLFPSGTGEHFLLVRKAMLRGGRVRLGQEARFRLEPDFAPRPLEVPPELERALALSRPVRRFHDSLSESMRRWCASEVGKLRGPDARRRRAERIAEQMLETIEAERELPPQVQMALREAPGAWAGWQRLTPLARRLQLLAIFHYRNPDSRARRIAKAVELAQSHAK